MGIVSKIVNILVLLAAIAAIVLGIMLFNKREDLTKGRENMAAGIVEANNVLLQSDNKGEKVTVDEFKVTKKANEVIAPVQKVKKNAEKAKKYHADASGKVSEIVKTVAGDSMTDQQAEKLTADLQDVNAGLAALGEVHDALSAVSERNARVRSAFDKLAENTNNAGSKLGMEPIKVTYEEADLKKVNDRLAQIGNVSIPELLAKSETYADHVQKVNGIYGQETQPLTGADFENILKDQRSLVEKTLKDLESVKNANEEVKKQLADNQKQMEENEKAVEESKEKYDKVMKELVAAKNKITELQNIINPPKKEGEEEEDNATEEEIQEETAIALSDYMKLQKIQGKVVFVDKQTGFAVIDLGRKVQFEYKDSNGKSVKNSVNLPMYGLMTTASSMDPAKAHCTGKLQLVKLGDKETIANILPMPGNKVPSVGDVVYFTSYDIETMRGAMIEKAEERTKNAAAKAAPAKQAAKEAAAAEEVADLIGSDEEEAPAKAAPAKKADEEAEESEDEESDEE